MSSSAGLTIITNNPAVQAAYGELTRYEDRTVGAVFTAVRDAVHLGAAVVSHPLAGSLKPNRTPCRSVVLTARHGEIDLKSLAAIEDAIAVLDRLPALTRPHGPRELEDYRVIDLDLVRSAMQTITVQGGTPHHDL